MLFEDVQEKRKPHDEVCELDKPYRTTLPRTSRHSAVPENVIDVTQLFFPRLQKIHRVLPDRLPAPPANFARVKITENRKFIRKGNRIHFRIP